MNDTASTTQTSFETSVRHSFVTNYESPEQSAWLLLEDLMRVTMPVRLGLPGSDSFEVLTIERIFTQIDENKIEKLKQETSQLFGNYPEERELVSVDVVDGLVYNEAREHTHASIVTIIVKRFGFKPIRTS